MNRQVVTAEDISRFRSETLPSGLAGGIAAAPAPSYEHEPQADTYKDRLMKYIPTEVVATWIFLDGIARSAPGPTQAAMLRWTVFLALLAGTWLYLLRVQRVTKRQQLAISTLAFAVWVISLGGPFSLLSWYSPVYGAILLPLYTFAIPVIQAEN